MVKNINESVDFSNSHKTSPQAQNRFISNLVKFTADENISEMVKMIVEAYRTFNPLFYKHHPCWEDLRYSMNVLNQLGVDVKLAHIDKFGWQMKIRGKGINTNSVFDHTGLEDAEEEYIKYPKCYSVIAMHINDYNKAKQVNEAKLNDVERGSLSVHEYGYIDKGEKKYPLVDMPHTKMAIMFFKSCPDRHKRELAKKIARQCRTFDIDLQSKIIKQYLN